MASHPPFVSPGSANGNDDALFERSIGRDYHAQRLQSHPGVTIVTDSSGSGAFNEVASRTFAYALPGIRSLAGWGALSGRKR
jgi:hypothetical protein